MYSQVAVPHAMQASLCYIQGPQLCITSRLHVILGRCRWPFLHGLQLAIVVQAHC